MNRKCQLPIQDDVSVYTYTYYGFANSIIQANRKFNKKHRRKQQHKKLNYNARNV